jgi:hypothetical protein
MIPDVCAVHKLKWFAQIVSELAIPPRYKVLPEALVGIYDIQIY